MVYSQEDSDEKSARSLFQPASAQARAVDLTQTNVQKLFSEEIRGVHLTGQITDIRTGTSCNIVESLLESTSVIAGDFQNCDWKDTSVRDSRFADCVFASATFAYNTFRAVVFEKSKFEAADFQNCDFYHTTFNECTFLYSLIKTCSFQSCKFIRCDIDNKLFETCRFVDCHFDDTAIQVQTIAENFGLVRSEYHALIRSDRVGASNRNLSNADLQDWITQTSVHPLHKANIEYFIYESFIDGSTYLDACLDLNSWISVFRTSKSFVVVLGQWIDFLLWLYRNNQTTAHTILAAHQMTGELLSALQGFAQAQATLAVVGGSHMSLARTIETYLELVDFYTVTHRDGALLLVEGDGDLAYYAKALGPLLENRGVHLLSVVPHNSPWELALSFATSHEAMLFFAFMFATRTHLELSQVRQRLSADQTSNKIVERSPSQMKLHAKQEPLLSIDLGVMKEPTSGSQLKFRAYLPGNLMAELRISVGSCQIAKLRKTIKGLL